MSQDSKPFPNPDQQRWVMICISHHALMARRLCTDAMQEIAPHSESGDALLAGAESLLEKIGLLAEVHSGDVVPDCVEDWMLPPVYRSAACK